ncbi:diguanylate cyclase domain-containing protein [Aquincola tertiaricarbonis]|uniref:diguanylate cyclase domain-containing protein n=1 Tax=Aquincola tertiaricarbonis TaxID=391953 RepID=UPI000695A7B5|nr:diguanylate cyclase [Aquincola tertiaricarbonis]
MFPSQRYQSSAPPLALWLFLLAIVATILATGTAFLVVDEMVERHEFDDSHELLRSNAASLRDALDLGMEQHFQQIKILSRLDQVTHAKSPAEVQRALDSYRLSFPQYAWIGLTNADGRVKAATDGMLQGVNVAKRDWFQAGLQAPFVGDVHKAVLLAKLLPAQADPWRFVDFAVPIRQDGKVVGVLGAHLSWGWAAELKQSLAARLAEQAEAEILVLDGKGDVLLGPKQMEGQRFDIDDADEHGRYVVSAARTRGYGEYQGLGWTVVLRQPHEVAMNGYRGLRNRSALWVALVCSLAAPLLLIGARRLARPLREVTEMMNSGQRLPTNWHAPYREADIFSRAFADYADRQKRANDELRTFAAELETRVKVRTAELDVLNKELADSKARMASILQHSPDAFIAMDSLGRVTDWNQAAEAMFGYTAEEATGCMMSELIVPPEGRVGHDGGFKRFVAGGPPKLVGRRVELETRHRDGRAVPVELSVGAIRSHDGIVAFGFLRDVTERRAAQAKLQASERRLHGVLNHLPALVGHFDSQERCLFANDLALKVHGLTREQTIGQKLRVGVSDLAYELHRPHIDKVLTGETTSFEGYEPARDAHYQAHFVPELDKDGAVVGYFLMSFNCTDLKRAQVAAERSQRQMRAVTDNLPMMISYIDSDQRLQFTNQQFEMWTGVPVADALGRPLKHVIGEQLFDEREAALMRALAGERVEFELTSFALGQHRILQTVYVPDMDSSSTVNGVYTLSTDVTALRMAERKMAELAMNDTLTGLPNRRCFNERLPQALARARRHRQGTALLFLDVDYFKAINDTHGHAAGDTVLQAFAERVQHTVRQTDFAARLAGDEFVVVLEGVNTLEETGHVAEKLVQAVRQPITLGDGTEVIVSTSIGAAFAPAATRLSVDDYLAAADRALYVTKEHGRDGHTCLQATATMLPSAKSPETPVSVL